MGLVGNMDIVDNMMLRSYSKGRSLFLKRKKPKDLANKINRELSEECGVVAKYFDCGELYSYID